VKLESGDEILKKYYGKLDGSDGALIMSRRKYVFVESKGFIRKTHTAIMDVPYENVKDMVREGTTKMTLKLKDGGSREFATFKLPVDVIKEDLEFFLKDGTLPSPDL